jgi:nanoRNase/pAp phosphatase (c-di-AMP/oligoRNAs hydrolase)
LQLRRNWYKAVGLSFNPSNDSKVGELKSLYAGIIDALNNFRNTGTPEQKRLASIAITEAQGAQMWAVKAVTWKD